MDPRIETLPSTTFFGRRLTRKQIADIQKTVALFPSLSRRELGYTVCEHLGWLTPKGDHRIQSCLRMLETLEELDILSLPEKDMSKRSVPSKKITWTHRTDEKPLINDKLDSLTPLSLQIVTDQEAIKEWNEVVDRHHYLNYRRPFGPHLRYFILDNCGRRLGCLLFEAGTSTLPCRDEWIGWQNRAYKKHLNLVVNNSRFLIFPWVKVRHLASMALSMATRQLPTDWELKHAFKPVLMETFVDLTKFNATSYRAANWLYLGKTNGSRAYKNVKGKTQKGVYVQPLTKNYQSILLNGPQCAIKKPVGKPTIKPHKNLAEPMLEDSFVHLWQNIIKTVVIIADEYDRTWQKRQRVLNTLLIILFIFRLVFSKGKQGYDTTLIELWEQCRILDIELPQPKPVRASTMCSARAKVDENIFKVLHDEILKQDGISNSSTLWKGHKVFAVDGSKINLPRQLVDNGYQQPWEKAWYPQGLVSCLYQLQSKIPVDFDLFAHNNERKAAQTHFKKLFENDVVVYDRGYYSYEMLHEHKVRSLHAVFRIRRNANTVFDEFINNDQKDSVIQVIPSKQILKELHKKKPQDDFKAYALRLVKYKIGQTTFVLGTTLMDQKKYSIDDLANLYHGRWSIEELYKISKELMTIEEFHSQSERGVKQELFAHFTLITLTRLFSNYTEDRLNTSQSHSKKQTMQTNFKNNLLTIARNIEGLFLQQKVVLSKTLNCIITNMKTCRQRLRPNRHYDRVSRKPIGVWRPSKEVRGAMANG